MLCGGFSAEVRAKKMRQDGSAEFISASLAQQMKKHGFIAKPCFLIVSTAPASLQQMRIDDDAVYAVTAKLLGELLRCEAHQRQRGGEHHLFHVDAPVVEKRPAHRPVVQYDLHLARMRDRAAHPVMGKAHLTDLIERVCLLVHPREGVIVYGQPSVLKLEEFFGRPAAQPAVHRPQRCATCHHAEQDQDKHRCHHLSPYLLGNACDRIALTVMIASTD